MYPIVQLPDNLWRWNSMDRYAQFDVLAVVDSVAVEFAGLWLDQHSQVALHNTGLHEYRTSIQRIALVIGLQSKG